jgi:hypothetical protein
MECRIIDLQDYAYGFLDPEAQARVREHLDGCLRCRADFERLSGEKRRLAGAAAGLSVRRDRRTLVPLGFAAALLLGLVWLLLPRDPAPAPVVVLPGAQDKGTEKKSFKEAPDDEGSLKSEIARLEAALQKTSDEQERGRIKTRLGDLQIRLERLTSGKVDETARKGKPETPKKPFVKGKTEAAEERVARLKAELADVQERIKTTQEGGERKRLDQRQREIEQELRASDPGVRMEINLKEVEIRLRSNPEDVTALVDRADWSISHGKADAAMTDLDRALSLKPDCAPAYLKRAIAHAMLGRQPEAWQDAKRGEELDLKASKAIDETYRTIKKLNAPKERKPGAGDLENQIATLRDRLDELRTMKANAELGGADRDRAQRDLERVQAEIERLTAELKSRPAEPEKKFEKKK